MLWDRSSSCAFMDKCWFYQCQIHIDQVSSNLKQKFKSLLLYLAVYRDNFTHWSLSYADVTNARIYKTSLTKLDCCCPTPPTYLRSPVKLSVGISFGKGLVNKILLPSKIFHLFFTGNVWFSGSVQRELNIWVQFEKTNRPKTKQKTPNSNKKHPNKMTTKKAFICWVSSLHITSLKFIICFSDWWLWRWAHWWAFNPQKLLQELTSVPVSTPTQLKPRVLNLACCLMNS